MLSKTKKEEQVKNLVKYLISCDYNLANILLWCPIIIQEKDCDYEACTDGKVIILTNSFFKLESELIQAADIFHEALHIAFRHVQTLKKNNYDMKLWNYATDAVINTALENINFIKLDSSFIKIENILNLVGNRFNIDNSTWTAENLYLLLKNLNKNQLKSLGSKSNDLNQIEVDSSSIPEYVKEQHKYSEETQEVIWKNTITRVANAGSKTSSIFRDLKNSIPKSKTNWKNLLKQYAIAPLSAEIEENYSKPGRRMLSLNNTIFFPNHKEKDSVKSAGIIVDTSGSINEELLNIFIGEIESIQRFTGCNIHLIFADADIGSQYLLKAGTNLKQKIKNNEVKAIGGGGTDFRPALKEMERLKVDVCIYLTDGWGDYPKSFKPPLIWAMVSNVKAPLGKTIQIKN